MLAQQATELVELVSRTEQLKKTVNERQAFDSRRQNLQELVAAVRPHVHALEALRAHGVHTPTLGERVAPARRTIEAIREEFHADPRWVVDPSRFKYVPFQRTIEALAAEFEGHVRQAWAVFTRSRSRDIDVEVLRVLALVPAFRPTVTRIQKAQERVSRLQATVPTGESDVGRFEDLMSEFDAAWAELGSDDVPREVLEFLRTAGRDGAPLDLLTDEVRDWLAERGILQSLRVRIS